MFPEINSSNVLNKFKVYLTSTWAAKLDSLASLLNSNWAGKLDSLRTGLTDTRMTNLDNINNTRMAKVDTVLTDTTTLKTDLAAVKLSTDTIAAVKTSTDRITTTWAGKLDTLATYLTSTWAAKLDSIRTSLTDQRMANLDAISEARMLKIDTLNSGITTTRAANLDLIPSIVNIAGVKPPTARSGVAVLDLLAGKFRNATQFTFIANNTWQTLTSVSGKGTVRFAAIDLVTIAGATTQAITIRVSIDGTVVLLEVSPTIGGGVNSTTITIMGNVGKFTDYNNANTNFSIITGLDLVPFNTSFLLEAQSSSMQGTYRYRTIIDYS